MNFQTRSSVLHGVIGVLYNTECFTVVKDNYWESATEIRFLNSSGQYAFGYIKTGFTYGNLAYYGVQTSVTGIGTCYRFKLRKSMTIVNPSGASYTTLSAGDYVYTTGATAGASNPANMHISAYKKSGTLKVYNGFLTLKYPGGSMINSNFCLVKA